MPVEFKLPWSRSSGPAMNAATTDAANAAATTGITSLRRTIHFANTSGTSR